MEYLKGKGKVLVERIICLFGLFLCQFAKLSFGITLLGNCLFRVFETLLDGLLEGLNDFNRKRGILSLQWWLDQLGQYSPIWLEGSGGYVHIH